MEKPGQIGEIEVIFGIVRLFWHYVLAQAGRAIRLDPRVLIRGTTNLIEVVERRYFKHFGRTSESARYGGWFSFKIRKVIAHILK